MKLIRAISKVMLLSAIIHVSILIFYSFKHEDFTKLNLFEIVGLDLIFPEVVTFSGSLVLSGIIVLGLFFYFYKTS